MADNPIFFSLAFRRVHFSFWQKKKISRTDHYASFILRTRPALNYLRRSQRSLTSHQHMGKETMNNVSIFFLLCFSMIELLKTMHSYCNSELCGLTFLVVKMPSAQSNLVKENRNSSYPMNANGPSGLWLKHNVYFSSFLQLIRKIYQCPKAAPQREQGCTQWLMITSSYWVENYHAPDSRVWRWGWLVLRTAKTWPELRA